MNYWWVNQNETHAEEIEGGYMWSPKRKRDGKANVFYENMTKVMPGDTVFSFFDTKVPYLGIITSRARTATRPQFSSTTARRKPWAEEGWMAEVDYRKLENVIRPSEHMNVLKPLLPQKYSPLQGNGNQGVYLTRLPVLLAEQLINLVGTGAQNIVSEASQYQRELETEREADRIESIIKSDSHIPETRKDALIKARRGQGTFRRNVIALHRGCPFTGVTNPVFLKAGHLKLWAECDDDQERLDPLNGIALTPVADQLLNDGYVTFDNNGSALFSSRAEPADLEAMGISLSREYRIAIVNPRQLSYLEHHRKNVFR